jgi:diaminohydroxyphosphoribosylaminopyrimidine deaminase / 5-amino-6-(5-phosphoribosylamino)uracil reductase
VGEETATAAAWEAILRGLRSLRGGGLETAHDSVSIGSGSTAAAALQIWAIYGPLIERRDLVLAQLGQTLDGRIATHAGHSHFVNGPEGIVHLHRLRALVDAVLVGAGTVVADNPMLTVRRVQGENPVRVVLDPSGRVSPEASVFQDGTAPTLWVRGARSGGVAVPPGVEEILLPERTEGGFDPKVILETLRARNLHRVLVEGGGITVSRFMDAGALDRLHVTVSPILLGSGSPALTLSPIDRMDKALRRSFRYFPLGNDLLFDVELRP